MNFIVEEKNGYPVVVVESREVVLVDSRSALDLIGTVQYETQSNRMVLEKALITEDFFQLRTKLAGEVLQKFVMYNVKLAIYGDFTKYTSQALQDFMYECNKGQHIFFARTKDEALAMVVRA